MEFKVGDRVRYVGDNNYSLAKPHNEIGIVTRVRKSSPVVVNVKWDTPTDGYPAGSTQPSYYDYRLALVVPTGEF